MMQLADSFFPTGSYTMSSGLEALFYKKKLNANSLKNLIKTHIEQKMGPADCNALGNAYEYASKSDIAGVVKADRMIFSMKMVQEVREASARSGTQLVQCVGRFARNKVLQKYQHAIKLGQVTGIYPVALAVACAALGVQKKEAGMMMLYSFCVNMTGAALRLGVLHHFDAQKVIHNLKPAIKKAVEQNVDRPLEGMWQFAPGIDILQIEHEGMDSKMFIT